MHTQRLRFLSLVILHWYRSICHSLLLPCISQFSSQWSWISRSSYILKLNCHTASGEEITHTHTHKHTHTKSYRLEEHLIKFILVCINTLYKCPLFYRNNLSTRVQWEAIGVMESVYSVCILDRMKRSTSRIKRCFLYCNLPAKHLQSSASFIG